ncbi:MAG: nucleotidyltransferase domain-containing protein [Candidatus Hydrogenedentota bacterium]
MTKTEAMRSLDQMLMRIVERFQPDRIILFGSYAKGDPTPDSDLDLLVVTPVEGSRRNKANEIDLALADRTIPLDVLVVTPDQFEKQKDVIGSIVREAVREGRTVYERAA